LIVLVTAGVTLVALLMLFLSARRDITLCELELEGGDLVVVRGGLAPSVLSDMRDVVRRERIKSGRLRVMRVIGQVPLSKLLAGAKAQGPKRKKRRA
jgi:hypothetical protein